MHAWPDGSKIGPHGRRWAAAMAAGSPDAPQVVEFRALRCYRQKSAAWHRLATGRDWVCRSSWRAGGRASGRAAHGRGPWSSGCERSTSSSPWRCAAPEDRATARVWARSNDASTRTSTTSWRRAHADGIVAGRAATSSGAAGASGAHDVLGAGLWRDRHWKGTVAERPARPAGAGNRNAGHASTARRCRRRSSRASCSGMKGERSRARSRLGWGVSNWRMAARSSWTRSAIFA